MNKKAFTLIEILFVIAVIGILAAIVIPRLMTSETAAKESACKANVANINTQIERWYFEKGSWPTIEQLAADSNYFPDGIPKCPVSGGDYGIDPNTHRVYVGNGHNHQAP